MNYYGQLEGFQQDYASFGSDNSIFLGLNSVFMIIFTAIFVLFFAVFCYGLFTAIKTKRKNDKSPRITVDAKIVAKRDNISYHSGTERSHGHHSTDYYVTFEVESGDRMELSVMGNDYGMLVEGDQGKLTFQGTRFIQFERGRTGYDLTKWN